MAANTAGHLALVSADDGPYLGTPVAGLVAHTTNRIMLPLFLLAGLRCLACMHQHMQRCSCKARLYQLLLLVLARAMCYHMLCCTCSLNHAAQNRIASAPAALATPVCWLTSCASTCCAAPAASTRQIASVSGAVAAPLNWCWLVPCAATCCAVLMLHPWATPNDPAVPAAVPPLSHGVH